MSTSISRRLNTLQKQQEARRPQEGANYPLIWQDIQRLTPEEVTRRLERAKGILAEQGMEAIRLCG